MSKIREHTSQILAIPDKERRKNQVGALESTRGKLQALAGIASATAEVCAASAVIVSATFVPKARQGIVQAGISAKQLSAHLTKGGTIAGNKRADELLTQLSERVSLAASTIQRGWSVVVQATANRYEPLAEVAHKLRLSGAPVLDGALSKVRSWEGKPPTTAKEAQDFNAAVEQVRGSVEGLGFKGKADAFMIAAAAGTASARDLLDPDVVAFLNEHPAIWRLLQVKLS